MVDYLYILPNNVASLNKYRHCFCDKSMFKIHILYSTVHFDYTYDSANSSLHLTLDEALKLTSCVRCN